MSRSVVAGWILGSLFLSSVVQAQPARDDAAARQYFDVGRTQYEAGRFEEAGDAFMQSYELSDRAQLL